MRIFYSIVSIIIILLIGKLSLAQNHNFELINLSKKDSIYSAKIPKLKLPDSYKLGLAEELPYKLNNAELPFFRNIFDQEGASCGQAASVGYAFTYEINRVRGLNGLLPDNQYPTHFAWNFMNGGTGFRGVSYFHSYELLQKCGTPTLEAYGGLAAGGDRRWMSGFNNYYNAMNNRIKEVYSIDVSNPDGLLTLKYWLHDHLDSSEYGGVANFYAASPFGERILAEGTPEGGKYVMTQWGPIATHAMTIVGYNDSIRFDLNFDGKFTNNIDINGDSIVDMKDWEYGALLFANSYGTSWDNEGYCYMMYRTLACDYGNGGIWNGTVNVMNVYEDYSPTLTMRVRLKYNSRENIKLLVGVNSDVQKNIPSYTMDFPLIDFQGGQQPMQGLLEVDTTDLEVIDLELDISKLLSHVNSGSPAKYFLKIIENDELNRGHGEIQYFSLVDRTAETQEIIYNEFPQPILNDWETVLSLESSISFEKPQIITDELPPFNLGENYSFNLQAAGGQPDYKWSIVQDYYVNPMYYEFPDINGEKVLFDDMDEANKNFNLKFPFPFYGDSLNEICVVLDGYVAFGEKDLSYPYYFGESTLLQTRKVIAPFMSDLMISQFQNNGVWVESTPEYFSVLWNTSYDYHNHVFDNNFTFALIIFPDGRIETYYDVLELPPYLMWTSGISKGDDNNFTINPFINNQKNPSASAYVYKTSKLPENIEIDNDGELSASGLDGNVVYNITASVEDMQQNSVSKTLQLSSGIVFDYEISSGDDDRIDFSEEASITLKVKNITNDNFSNLVFNFSIEDDNFSSINSEAIVGDLIAGQTKVIDSAFVFKVSNTVNDNYYFVINAEIHDQYNQWYSDIYLNANAAQFVIGEREIIDDNNGLLDAGESVTLKYTLLNIGHVDAEDVSFRFMPNSDYLNVDVAEQNIDYIQAGNRIEISFDVSADFRAPSGYIVQSELEVDISEGKFQTFSIPLNIGRIPVLLLSLADDSLSALQFKKVFDSLKINYQQKYYCPEDLSNYQSVFVCLGGFYQNHQLDQTEASILNNYLISGGKIYLEGTQTWFGDNQYALQNKFGVECNPTGNYFQITNLSGVEGNYTDDIELSYGGNMNFINYYFLYEESAFPFLNYYTGDTVCAVANKTSVYKTIASPILFGYMEDAGGAASTTDYVESIVEFFNLEIQYLNVEENSSGVNPLEITVFPNPSSNKITIQGLISNTKISLYSLDGKLVKCLETKNESETTINISNLKRGVYIIAINNNSDSISRKIIKF